VQTVRTSEELTEALAETLGQSVALVPTMGALHAGHMALIAEAKKRADKVVTSLFVNPTQFNDKADLERYPRDEGEDARKLQAAGCDLLWAPSVADIYPQNFATTIHVAAVSERWEGEHRPGHFDGVATVVAKLLLSVLPDVALFGEKDFQQLAVIRRMVADLSIPTEIVGVPTVRDSDGLAMSSRNALLSADERAKAPSLFRELNALAEAIVGGESVDSVTKSKIDNLIQSGFGPVDYVAYVDSQTLEPIGEYRPGGHLIAAAFLGKVRLIDNVAVERS